MIWPDDVYRAVVNAQLRKIVMVAADRRELGADARQAIGGEVAAEFAAEMRVHAVDLQPEDVRVAWTEAAGPHGSVEIRVTAWWSPEVSSAELVGGPSDGDVIAVQEHQREVRLPYLTAPQMPPLPELEHCQVSTGTLTYERAGWNDSARRWRYALAS